jgi:hypothetical protein
MIEQTMEFNLVATAGTGNAPIPANSFGLACAIFPHAYNDMAINNGAGYVPGQLLANLRFF